jgi:branched-chain amino acid transport system permease protein
MPNATNSWKVETPILGPLVLLGVGVILALLPLFGMGAGAMRLMVEVFAMIAMAQAWNLLAGYTGFVSVGQQAFIGIGAYGLFLFAIKGGVDPFLSVFLGGVVAAGIGAAAAPGLFHLRGPYFAIGTWVLAELFRIFITNTTWFGGASGLTLARVMRAIPRDLRTNATYWIALALAMLSILLIYALLRSRFGLAVRTVRDNEVSAGSVGVNVWGVKFAVFVIASFITGCAGGVAYLNTMFLTTGAAFTVEWSALIIFVVIIGGIGSIEGPIIGALVYFFLREYLADFGTWYVITLGTIAIVVMLVAPEGLWGLLTKRFKLGLFPAEARMVPVDASVLPVGARAEQGVK